MDFVTAYNFARCQFCFCTNQKLWEQRITVYIIL